MDFKGQILCADEKIFLQNLFKRFFFKSIELKYGYLKANTNDEPLINTDLFCKEMELPQNLIKLFSI